MSNNDLALFLALGATLSFATASLVFAEFSKRVSVVWMNCFKASLAFVAFCITVPLVTSWHQPSWQSITGFMLSGFIGLNIGDLFILGAFTRLGAARTLILFGFQPLLVGLGGAILFDQPLNPARLVAVVFLIGCLFTFSLERYRAHKHWELRGLLFALTGVALDTVGILLTRASFGASPDVTPLEGNLWRCGGAVLGFALMSYKWPIRLKDGFLQWPTKTRALLIAAGLGGTFVSLSLYLTAIKIGHLASIAGIAITGPIFAATLECIHQRQAPSRYLIIAFLFFLAGFYVLLTTA
ncbi:MAG TPA: DMT family transporter [Bdellovibrionales bacterium]|nr:DMT family transporter [Bdellovibrionales bacterium]